VNAGNKPSKRRHVDARLSAVYAEADRWAERERERDLMAVLVEAAQLKSAARAWYRRQAEDSGGEDLGRYA
jgi:hypothetical protein